MTQKYQDEWDLVALLKDITKRWPKKADENIDAARRRLGDDLADDCDSIDLLNPVGLWRMSRR